MGRSVRLAFLATAVLAGAVAHATAARADEPPAPTDGSPLEPTAPPHDAGVEEARALFRRGVALAQTSSWEDARSAFERSNQLRPHPVTLYNVAFCEQALGHYTLAARDFASALEGDDSPGLSHLPPELETMARRDLQKIQGELSTVIVVVRDRNDRLLVDGRPLAPAGEHEGRPILLAGTREPGPPERVSASTIQVRLDPGFHVFRIFHEDAAPRDVARTLRPAETTRLELSNPEPRAPEPQRADEAPSSDSKRVAAYWALGVAGAGALLAGTFGTLALLERSDLTTSCRGHVCGPDQASSVSRLGTYSDLTTAGLAVAGAGLAVGGYLLFTSSPARNTAQSRSRRHDVRLSLGVGSVSVDGVF